MVCKDASNAVISMYHYGKEVALNCWVQINSSMLLTNIGMALQKLK